MPTGTRRTSLPFSSTNRYRRTVGVRVVDHHGALLRRWRKVVEVDLLARSVSGVDRRTLLARRVDVQEDWEVLVGSMTKSRSARAGSPTTFSPDVWTE